MAFQKYTAEQLLRLRKNADEETACTRLMERVKMDADLSEIIGKRSIRHLPLIRGERREVSFDSLKSGPRRQATTARQLDGTDSDWKYRGQSDSENAEGFPATAAAETNTQKDEGFQRFFQAVASPTHVRVTAGGRIVPNTRAHTSPTSKWNKDRTNGEGASNAQPSTKNTTPEQSHLSAMVPQPNFSYMPTMMPGYPAPMSHAMPGTPFPMVPWQMGMNVAAYGMPQMQIGHPDAARQAPIGVGDATSIAQQSHGMLETSGQPRASHEQFDHTRAYVVNGHWAVPQPPAFGPFGVPGMSPYAGYPAPHMQGPATMPPQMIMGNAAVIPFDANSSQGAYGQAPRQAAAGPLVPNSGMTSIRQSEVTKKQIENLQNLLRHLENQLQYNKHQIDEKATQLQILAVRHHLQDFEKSFEEWLEYENAQKAVKDKGCSTTSRSEAVEPSRSGTVRVKKSTGAIPRVTSVSAPSEPAVDTNVSETAETSLDRQPKARSLPSNAALAAPFKPSQPAESSKSCVTDSSSGSSSACGAELFTRTPGTQVVAASEAHEATTTTQKLPYLSGKLPRGISPDEVKDTDYVYPRQLTADELRARHLYWGSTPRYLQKGLPKFDGKDFYPPSPAKELSGSDVTSSTSVPDYRLPVSSALAGQKTVRNSASYDPFLPMPKLGLRDGRATQGETSKSEMLPRGELSTSSTEPPAGRLTMTASQGVEESRKAVGDKANSGAESPQGAPSSDDDGKELIFKGRRAMSRQVGNKPRNDILPSMLKKGPSSAHAVPGTISSTTAQGVLPNYSGHATASLTPAATNTTVSPRSVNKMGDSVEVTSAPPGAEKRDENRPPTELAPRGGPARGTGMPRQRR